MAGDNLYIYCIASKPDKEPNLSITGHNGEPVFGVLFKDLVAIVSNTELTHFDTTLENLECHERVISKIMEELNVLPMSFSTICKSQENLMILIDRYYDQFKSNLEIVDGKVELGIKVFYKLDFDNDDKIEKEENQTPKDYMMKRYQRYQDRKKRTDEVLSCIEDFHQDLSEIASQSCYTKPMKNNLIFNASYLVPKDKKAEFEQAVSAGKSNNPSYKIIYSGPWPAYHFVKITRVGEEDE